MTQRLPRAVVLIALAGCSWPLRTRHAGPVDVNNGSVEAFAQVPGLSAEDANRIVAGRPYYLKDDLVTRGILTKEQYSKVRDSLVVGKPGVPDYLKWVPPEP